MEDKTPEGAHTPDPDNLEALGDILHRELVPPEGIQPDFGTPGYALLAAQTRRDRIAEDRQNLIERIQAGEDTEPNRQALEATGLSLLQAQADLEALRPLGDHQDS